MPSGLLVNESGLLNDNSGTLMSVLNADTSSVTLLNTKVQALVNIGSNAFTGYPLSLANDTNALGNSWTWTAAQVLGGGLSATGGEIHLGNAASGGAFLRIGAGGGYLYLEAEDTSLTGSAAGMKLTGYHGNAGLIQTFYNTLDDSTGKSTWAGLATFSSGITGTGSVGTLTVPWGNLTSVPSLVNTFNGRSGTVVPASGDYSFPLISGTATSTQLPSDVAYLDVAQTWTAMPTLSAGAWIGTSGSGYIRAVSDGIYDYLEGTNSAQNGVLPLMLTGYLGKAVAVHTAHNVLDNGSGNIESYANLWAGYTANGYEWQANPIAGNYIDILWNLYYNNGWASTNGGPGARIAMVGGTFDTAQLQFEVSTGAKTDAVGSAQTLVYPLILWNNGGASVGVSSTPPSNGLLVSGLAIFDGSLTAASISATDGSVHGSKPIQSNYNWTCPPGVYAVWVELIGGGGGGGGGSGNSTGGGGGGGGGGAGVYAVALVQVTPGNVYSATIGAGGSGGAGGTSATTGHIGGTGGTTSFASVFSALGGIGGSGGIAGGGGGSGGSGNQGATGDYWNEFAGGDGGTGATGSVNPSGGAGGAQSRYGGSGGTGGNSGGTGGGAGSPGGTGTQPGGGGGGGGYGGTTGGIEQDGGNGGNGGAGWARISW